MAKRQNHNVQPIKDSNVLKQVQDTSYITFKQVDGTIPSFNSVKRPFLELVMYYPLNT